MVLLRSSMRFGANHADHFQSGTEPSDVSIPAGATLQQVRDSINSQYSNQGLSANILTDATGSRMVLTSTTTGVGSDLTLSGNSGLEAGTSVVETPQNAKYTLDGVAMESKTNTIADAVSGVTIKLQSFLRILPAGTFDADHHCGSTTHSDAEVVRSKVLSIPTTR